jgi:diketogulonate reductase-like aldo/keto reductase
MKPPLTPATPHRIGKCEVPAIGQGTWNIEKDGASGVTALRRGLDLGLTHIDTAEMYGEGAAERVVGEAIRGRREEVFLVSKVLPSHARRAETFRACARTLRNLGTDRLDLYLLHWRGPIPLEETLGAFEELVEEGKIAAYGVSNFDVPDLEEAWKIPAGKKIVCNQVLYHLKERTAEARVLPWCAERKIAMVAYSPFGQSDFSGEDSPGGRALAEIGARHGKTARQIALHFLVRDRNVLAIPKSGQARHVEENAGALDFTLPPGDVDKIESAFPLRAKKGLPTL